MSILKMKFISIVGKREFFNDFVTKYIINSGIQLENAMLFLDGIKGLSHYVDEDYYSDILKQSTNLLERMGIKAERSIIKVSEACEERYKSLSLEEISQELAELENELNGYSEKIEKINEKLKQYTHMKKQLELLSSYDIDVDLYTFFNFKFIKFRFGRISRKLYQQLQLYLEDLQVIALPISQDKDYVWMIYFTPETYSERIDGIFSSLHFERIWLPGEFKGTPAEALIQLQEKIEAYQKELESTREKIKNFNDTNKEKVLCIHDMAVKLNRIVEVRKYAAYTKESFYLTGWIPEDELEVLKPVLDKLKDITFIEREPEAISESQPPTQLKNNRLIKPFETLVKMYGLPSYNEVDPSFFIAATYFIMFGFMFGDVGQGLILLAAGLFALKRGVSLGGVAAGVGISSIIFGFVYGSVFGFEDWLPVRLISPMEDTNTMLVIGVIIGVLMMTIAMGINIVNGIRRKNFSKIFLDRNGVAGFCFYWIILLTVLYYVLKQKLPFSTGILLILLILPILAMIFKEPLEEYIHNRKISVEGKGMFLVEAFFEMFDTVLSFMSNTISFIRLSAFALNHIGLFMAVRILAEMSRGSGKVVTIIIGNIIIIGLEGLIVAIQALRLEYYELFSRFFTGGGRIYEPIKDKTY
ncbi:MAG TPA: V-type ATP synthase subunit I [Clostridiaceae bacterium]|nr:V-type ATP synthase subunit I [Clostridiaceae bacterium]